jgi:UDP-glucose 4-epimerase
MRVVVTGATGNLGTSCLQLLAEDRRVSQIVALARRAPRMNFDKTQFVELDVSRDVLEDRIEGADAVVHLAWELRPSHDRAALWRNNVEGSTRVFSAAARTGVRTLVYSSSIAAYSPGAGRTDESWPRDGIPASNYSTQKVAVERRLDELEQLHPQLRVVRFRPALVFKRGAASGIQRLFLGSGVPSFAFRPGFVPFVPRGLKLQCVHSIDVGQAVCLAVLSDVRGAFNLAAEPPLDAATLARLLKSRTLPVPAKALRALVSAAWELRLQPSEPGFVDLAFDAPLLSAERARLELGWRPRYGSEQALNELLDGLREGAGLDTPRLWARTRAAERTISGLAPHGLERRWGR